MNPVEVQRELLAFDEKIALAELEVNKAEGRVRELKYQKARFLFEITVAQCAVQDKQRPSKKDQ